jgi:hypothetical protein
MDGLHESSRLSAHIALPFPAPCIYTPSMKLGLIASTGMFIRVAERAWGVGDVFDVR